ncbi:putative signal transduction histidine-protein kinase [Triangularia setosa]|uniref:Signal transduction histidine-protein kinase n=1 Tax=Triangularia setosa TaxID=2587417 RepID=A0AAN6W1L1_9PEZI|nr:putative signal transduction histidine-protein kinase [Podospora setosa]
MHDHGGGNASAHPDIGLLFDLSPLPSLILSPSWRITRASARFLNEWHLSAEACIGQELLPFVQNQLSPSPVHLKFLTTAIDDAIAARAERTSMPMNTRRSVSWRARVIPYFKGDELLAIITEWQEGPLSQLNLIKDEEVQPGLSTDEAFRILVQAVKDYAIFLLDTSGHIATWNTGAELLKGYRRDEIVGKHFSVFYGKEDLDIKKPEMELEICMRDGRVEDEGWRYRKDGSRFWANVVITAVYKDGVHVGFGKVTRDLTERKSAESRLISAYEESEKLKSDFLANMSHEIRTPMHGMLSACALLLDTTLSPRQRDIVGIMDESGQVLLQVINDILDYSKLASGSFSIHSDIVGITSIVTSVVRSVQTTLPPSVHFELFLAPDLPRSVQGDPLRYRQILHNIVGNAAKFTEKGCIRVRAGVQREDHDSYVVMTEVTDTGIGIPEVAAAGLFTPFTQFDATTTKQYKGTGLGLSIAKSLTELMGGSIGYRPNPERHGSIFWFTARFKKIKSLGQIQDWKSKLIRKGDAMLAIPEADVVSLRRELAEVAPVKSLLLVEDNIINQKVMLGLLRSLGFKNIALASNGSEAVNMVRNKPAAYDIVLMDINMPIMDGHQASRAIRDAGIRVPIVAMTAYALKGDRERCLEHGMNDYIPKPVDKKYLIKVLGKWLLHMKDYRKAFDEQMNKLRGYETLTLAPKGNMADRLQQLSLTVRDQESTPDASDKKTGEETNPLKSHGTQSSDETINIVKPTSESGYQHASSVVSSPRFEPLLPPVQPEMLDSFPDLDLQATGDIIITSTHGSHISVEAADSGGDTGTSTSGTTATTPLDPTFDSEKGSDDVAHRDPSTLQP